MNLTDAVTSRGGLAATHELLRAGWRSRQLTRAVSDGSLIRVRQGWYASADTNAAFQQAVRVGGRLGCISAARAYGLWVPGTRKLHVSVEPHVSRLRSSSDRTVRLNALPHPGVVVHWSDERLSGNRFSVSLRDCLRQMCHCQAPESVVAAVDSALHKGLITKSDWLCDIRGLPGRLPSLLESVDALSESIIESLTRYRLGRVGLRVRIQVKIRGVGRVDILIGDRLVIELDGWEFHSDLTQFEEDRRRDAVLSSLGYRVLRFSYSQVMHQQSQVMSAILASVARGDHLA
jgi:very-short-patch-repair endonuclease